MEKSNTVKRSETWFKIYDIVKNLPVIEHIGGDSIDAPSVTTSIEQLFLKLLSTQEVSVSSNDESWLCKECDIKGSCLSEDRCLYNER